MSHHFIKIYFSTKKEDGLKKMTQTGSWQPDSDINVFVTLSLVFSFNHNPEKTLPQTGFGL